MTKVVLFRPLAIQVGRGTVDCYSMDADSEIVY